MSVTAKLHINLKAIVANYLALREAFTGEECAAVVKSNAYGTGVERVAPALFEAGCKVFYVATLDEAIDLRKTLPLARICVFHGVQRGEVGEFLANQLTPVLNSQVQMERWADSAGGAAAKLHFDTAMARLGLTEREFKTIREEKPALLEACNITMLLTHLSNASDPNDPINEEQRARFAAMSMHLPDIKRSMCNSGGIGLGPEWHCDLARPGCGLYGIAPAPDFPIALGQVAKWEAPILQIRTLDRDQTVSYGGDSERPKGARLATVASGYADGIQRDLSNNLYGLCAGVKVPLVGRVTMDMLIFDVSEVPEQKLAEAESILLMWDGQDVNALADRAGTIGYEILSRIGRRVIRDYGDVA